MDPLNHYLNRGRSEGRAPSADFDPAFYLQSYVDVATSGLDPFAHYLSFGRKEGRLPRAPQQDSNSSLKQAIARSGLFDPDFYCACYPEVVFSGQDPLDHYIQHGRKKGCKPSAAFDPQSYLFHNPDIAKAGVDPFTHFIESGRTEGRRSGCGMDREQVDRLRLAVRSSGLFNESFYLSQCPGVKEAKVDPLLHYLFSGAAFFLDPDTAFSTADYIRQNPGVIASNTNPLLDFLGLAPEPDRLFPPSESFFDHSLNFELKAGQAFFNRFVFSFDSTNTNHLFVPNAVAALTSRSPSLTVNRDNPDVSIIIPVFGQIQFLLNCLDSLFRQQSRYSVEIIVADDCSPEESQVSRVEAIPWLRYLRHTSNLGFIGNCNEAASAARGNFLIFLNSDTRILEGWLDELVGSFDLFPKAGLIGSKLINSDGTLQEAGGIYWRDGSAWNYGRNDDPNHPKYCFARQVDYVSGASIAVPANLWKMLDGFDLAFSPAYCEDADLAFRLKQAGYEVWLQPLSRVIHYEGRTHGRDLSQGNKRYQRINMRQFARKWRTVLADHRPNGVFADQEANRTARERVLVLDAVTPAPDRDSGSFTTVRMLKAFQALGYQVTFIPQHNYQHKGTYTEALERVGVECLYEPFIRNITQALDFRSKYEYVLAYRGNVLEGVYDTLRARMPSSRIIFHNVDLHFLREEREAALFGSRSKKISAALMRSTELDLFAKVDCSIVHTPVEAEIIKRRLPVDNIVEFPYIAEVHRTSVAFEDRHDIMFLGGLNHPPNVDAVKYFATSLWPNLSQKLPAHARFLIVGASAPAEVEQLARPNIVVTGYVSDLQPYFDQARVFVAPIRYGAGIKGKVIQSLCYGTPSVISPIAAEGIGLTSGIETLVADDDKSFAEQVLNVYSCKSVWSSLQSEGYKFAEANFSWQRSLDLTTKVMDTADRIWLDRHERALNKHLTSFTAEAMAQDTWVKPGHFYSPIVNPSDPHVVDLLRNFDTLELDEVPGLVLNEDKMARFFETVSKHYKYLPFVEHKAPNHHFYFENPSFSFGDAIMLGLNCLEFRPKRILEVGSGFSSAAMIDLNERLFAGQIELTFFDPYPDALLALLPQGSPYRSRIISKPVQSVPVDLFRQLQANDILFIDSTHVSKMASDVNHLFFKVIPLLQPGTLVHIHDILYPFEYPPSWILDQNRSWNEAYLLRAFLQFNPYFEILFYNHFAVRKFPELLKSKTPSFLKNGGGSFWMRRNA